MMRHFMSFIAKHQSPGLVIVEQRAKFAYILDDLVTIWADSTFVDLPNQVRWLPPQDQLR